MKINVDEKKQFTLKAGTFVEGRGSDAGVQLSSGFRNALGGGEQLFCSGSYGTKETNEVSMNFVKPFFYGLPASIVRRM